MFNAQHTVGDNRVSSTAIVYDEFITFETLVEGSAFPLKVDDDGWALDEIHGHPSFEEMVMFHERMLKNVEEITGLERVTLR